MSGMLAPPTHTPSDIRTVTSTDAASLSQDAGEWDEEEKKEWEEEEEEEVVFTCQD